SFHVAIIGAPVKMFVPRDTVWPRFTSTSPPEFRNACTVVLWYARSDMLALSPGNTAGPLTPASAVPAAPSTAVATPPVVVIIRTMTAPPILAAGAATAAPPHSLESRTPD